MLQCHIYNPNASPFYQMKSIDKLAKLRSSLKKEGVDGFLIPRADQWPGEFISEHSERLKWLTNFTGSAGVGIVLENKAVVLTDGRYTLQVQEQLDSACWSNGDITKISISDWLIENAKEGHCIGFDPYLHSIGEIEDIVDKLDEKQISLKALPSNPIDELWSSQPEEPNAPVTIFDDQLAGQTVEQKLEVVSKILKEEEVEQFFLTMPDSIAWLLNVRGNDVVHTPVPLSYGLVKADGTFDWFIDRGRVPADIIDKLKTHVTIKQPQELESTLAGLNSLIGIDEKRTSYAFPQKIAMTKDVKDPCILLKACKNDAEQDAIRHAHIKDGQALIEFHRWLKDQEGKTLNELGVEQKLEEFRQKHGDIQSPSFDTIAGFAGNGAIIHYRATKSTNKKIKDQGLLLIDSGAQYLSDTYAGTTDVTRTYIIGKASNEEKYHYTTVLRAHIAVAKAQFPYGTTGVQIDAIARSILWQEGLDFAHGLGHGVGCFLNVHEEASHLSPRGVEKLEPGMLLSNEPGLYFEGKYGIRIENLLFVQKTGNQDILGRDILHFETVTLAPYDNDLIDFNLLNGAEMEWLEN